MTESLLDDEEGAIRIGPTDHGMVRFIVTTRNGVFELDYAPEDAEAIAEELQAAAERARAAEAPGERDPGTNLGHRSRPGSHPMSRTLRIVLASVLLGVCIVVWVGLVYLIFFLPRHEAAWDDMDVALPASLKALVAFSQWLGGRATGQAIPGVMLLAPPLMLLTAGALVWLPLELIVQLRRRGEAGR